jgi:hypothetical protein
LTVSLQGVESVIAEKDSVLHQNENARELVVKDPDPTTIILQQQDITKILECIRLRAAVKRIANEPWNESIRIQSRPPETPMLPFFPSIRVPWNPADQLALPTLVGPRLMESILQSHSSFLRIDYSPAALLPVLDSSQYSFSLLNTLQGKGGNFGPRPLGISWAQTLQEERAPNIPRDQDSRAIVPYQGPKATVQSETVVPVEWIVALSLAMAAIQHNIAIPGAQTPRPVPSPSFNDQWHGAKRKRETRDQLDQQPNVKQFFLANKTSKTEANHEDKSPNKLSSEETRSSKVTFAQAAKRPHNSHQIDPGDVAREGGEQLPGPISEQSFAKGAATANDEAGRLESSRKRDRKERKKERQEKRARKKAKKLEKKRKRSESCEQHPQEGSKDCNGQLPEAKDRRKAPPGSSFSAVTESHQTANRDPRNAMSLQFVEQELDKARTTLLKKAREKSREAVSSSGIPRATLPSTYDRAPSRPAPPTIKRNATATQTVQNTRNHSQHQPSSSTSLLQQQRNDAFDWNCEMEPGRIAPVEKTQVSEGQPQGFRAPQHGAGNDSFGWKREKEPDRKIAAVEAPQVSEVRLQGFRARQQGAGNNSTGWNHEEEPDGKVSPVDAPQASEIRLQAPQQGAVPWSWSRAQKGNEQTQPGMATNPSAPQNTHRMHPGFPPEHETSNQPLREHEMNFQQENLEPSVSNVAEGRSKYSLQQGFAPLVTKVENPTLQAAPVHQQRLSTCGGPGPGGALGYSSLQGQAEDMPHLSQEDQNTDHSRLPPAKVLCSEQFIESWGDVVAELASGRWAHSFPANEGSNEAQTVRCWGRKVELRDTPMVDQCGVDIELSNRCAILLYNISTLEAPQQAREVVIGLAQLVAIGRYKQVCIILCYDVPVTSSITRHIVQLQTAVMSSDGNLSTSTFFKTASPATLSTTIAQTVFVHNQAATGTLSEPPTDVVTDEQIGEWSRFLLSLLPTLSAHGAIQCIQLAQQIASSGPSFGLLFQSVHARQQITTATTSNPCRAPAIHPHAMAQLSHILRVSLGKSAHHENGVVG